MSKPITNQSHLVTIFKDIHTTSTPFIRDADVILERIKNGSSKELVKKIRKEKDKAKRNELKKGLPSILFSGTFNKRSDVALQQHSGLLCLDFDGYTKADDLKADKKKFGKSKWVYACFISPSGLGLKVIVKITRDPDKHIGHFLALEKHFKSSYFDKTTKNLSRVCYESFDPLLIVNPDSKTWEAVEDVQYKEVSYQNDALTIPIQEESKIVEILKKWWLKKFPMIKGQRNHNAYILARALNEYGIQKSSADLILGQYKNSDFRQGEIDKAIKSAYSNVKDHNTKYYEDEDKVNNLQQRLRRGESKKIIVDELVDSGFKEDEADKFIEKANEDNSVKFWTKTKKGVIKIVPMIFKKFLKDNGYSKYCPEGQKNYVFVRSTNNLIDHTSEKEIKDFILNYLEGLEDMSIYNYFADQTRFFKEEYLTLLETIDVVFIEDNIDTSYLYYENCALEISKEGVREIDYVDLEGSVWREHVISRPYEKCEYNDCDYKKFISLICNKNQDRIKTMESTIGFMMHGHKNVSYCPAVILNDEVISDSANGGTGKGIWIQALGHMKKVVMIDGKAFNFDKSFPYQLVSADTQVLVFDDVKKHFDFERLFSVITEGIELEKKNKSSIKIPFEKSPKVIISSNYAIRGSGSSFSRRKWELELSQHYNLNHTPLDDFNKFLFGDWDEEEWCEFDNYMINCIQLHLKKGLIKSEFVNLNIRQLSAETCHEFVEWCGLIDGAQGNPLLVTNTTIYTKDLFNAFVKDYPDYGERGKMSISRIRFNKWVTAYCIFKEGLPPESRPTREGKVIRIRPRHEGEQQQDLIF